MTSILHGFLIGIANIIPGVSGGTMALMLGIYEKLLSAISGINGKFIIQFIAALKSGVKPTSRFLASHNIYWLASIALGALVAIVLTSSLITYLMSAWHDPTYGFFLGLVLFSIVVPLKMLKARPQKAGIAAFIVAMVMTLAITNSLSADEKAANALAKHELKISANFEDSNAATETAAKVPPSAFDTYFPMTSLGQILPMFLAGALAISAMILPGISGAFVLLLIGSYFEILEAIAERNMIVIGAVGAGCIVGLLLFTKLLNYVLAKFHDQTVMSLIGLMVGSLFGLWPFQRFITVGGRRIDLEPIVPAIDNNFYLTILSFVAAGTLVLVFLKLDNTSN